MLQERGQRLESLLACRTDVRKLSMSGARQMLAKAIGFLESPAAVTAVLLRNRVPPFFEALIGDVVLALDNSRATAISLEMLHDGRRTLEETLAEVAWHHLNFTV